MMIDFSPNSEPGKVLAEWWLSLKDEKGTRAELRRCDSVAEVVMAPSFQRLCFRMRPCMKEEYHWEERLAAVLGLVAHLKHDAADVVLATAGDGRYVERFAAQMAQSVGDRPVVSELRFRRLLQRERADLYPSMIRILRMLGGKASIFGLAQSVFYWGEHVKKSWAYAYFPLVPEKKTA